MIRRFVGSSMVLAVVLLAGETVYAAPRSPSSDVPARAKVSGRLVSFQLRNDYSHPLKVKAGDEELTLAPGKAVKVKLHEGATIVAEESTPSFTAGSVLATVSSGLSDATVAIK